MIVAHPDDEDGGMLTLESRGFGARTAILTLTRGEGGQNAMSSEENDALGLIRTNELLLADQYSGTEQFFSRVADYGFSKTIDEAHQQWGRDRVLYDVVRAVRMYRPMVITSVFTGNITDGHGHHQVSGEAAQEVFKLAGRSDGLPGPDRARPAAMVAVQGLRAHSFLRGDQSRHLTTTRQISGLRSGSTTTSTEAVDQHRSVDRHRNPRGHLRPDPGPVVHSDVPRGLEPAEVAERRREYPSSRGIQCRLSPLWLARSDQGAGDRLLRRHRYFPARHRRARARRHCISDCRLSKTSISMS